MGKQWCLYAVIFAEWVKNYQPCMDQVGHGRMGNVFPLVIDQSFQVETGEGQILILKVMARIRIEYPRGYERNSTNGTS